MTEFLQGEEEEKDSELKEKDGLFFQLEEEEKETTLGESE